MRDVAAGCHLHNCAVAADGSVWCWGENDEGQLGDGGSIFRTTPVRAGAIDSAVQVSVGVGHSCARLEDGSVHCWGKNDLGQLGSGTFADRLEPGPVRLPGSPAPRVEHVSVGCFGACAIDSGGRLYCWGDSRYLGRGAASPGAEPVQPDLPCP